MKTLFYLALLGLIGCSDGGNAELTRQETEKLSDEVVAALKLIPKSLKAPIFQQAYLKLDGALLQYPNADPELIVFTKDSREFLKSMFDLAKQTEWSTENIINGIFYVANTLTGHGESLLEANKKFSEEKNQIIENINKLSVRGQQLSAKLCKKYQVSCKEELPAKK